jgi:hypothetical protein
VYLAGHKDVSAAMVLFSGGTLSNRITSYFGVFIYVSLIGAIAYTVAVWKSESLPKMAGVLVGAGFVLSMTISPFVGWAGAIFLIVGGAWLATCVRQAGNAVPVPDRNLTDTGAGRRAPETR